MDPLTARTRIRFEKAVASLETALSLDALPDHAERDAALLRFELAAELMPKLLRRILQERGAATLLPKDAVREALAAALVTEDDATTLLAVIDDRNRMVHDYAETYADELLARVKASYGPTFRALLAATSQPDVGDVGM